MDEQKAMPLSRSIPQAVKKHLRNEAGFGCPVPDCGNPYLEYHHFDPPWAIEEHQDPERMIALCATHHAKAGAWTVEQVRAMKVSDPERPEVQGRIEWMRHNVLAVVGGNFYYETPTIFMLDGRRVVWFERDERRHLLLNISMDVPGEMPRTSLSNNNWTIRGDPQDVESPPNGSQLSVKYPDGDFLKIRFREHLTPASLGRAYPSAVNFADSLQFPIVVAQVELKIRRAHVHLEARKTVLPGNITIRGSFLAECEIGLSVESERPLSSSGTPESGSMDRVFELVRANSHLLREKPLGL